jgi:hypothetical protein
MSQDPDGQKFTYHGVDWLRIRISQLGGLAGIVIFNTFGILFFLIGLTTIQSPPTTNFYENPFITLGCFTTLMIMFSWYIGSLMINFSPTVWINDQGIVISHFVYFRIFIPWKDIVDVIEVQSVFTRWTLVTAKRISLFHSIWNRLFFNLSYPCFNIGDKIDHRDKLIAKIRGKALFHAQQN